MPVLTPGTEGYRNYYNAVTLPGDSPPAPQQKVRNDDDPFAGAEAHASTGDTGRARADMSKIRRNKVDSEPAPEAQAKTATKTRSTADRARADMSRIKREPRAFTGAQAKGKAGARIQESVDPTRAAPVSRSANAAVLRVSMLLPYRNPDGSYDLAGAVDNPMILASNLRHAGFRDEQIVAAQAASLRKALGMKQANLMIAGCCPTSMSQSERVDKLAGIMADIHKKLAAKQESEAAAGEAAKAESARTHVALPGEERTWYHWPTGSTVSDAEYKRITENGRNAKAEEYSRTATQVRREAIATTSAFVCLASRVALPEVTRDDITWQEILVSTAQLATWALPFVPKGAGGVMAGGAATVFGVNTAQHWNDLSTAGKAVSVAATALLLTSSVHSLVQPSFKPVKVPLKDGTEAVVWSGLSVRGKPVVGVTKLPPDISKVAAGWRPITKTEATVLGTRDMLAKMGVPDDEITKVLATVEETKAFQGMRSPYEPKQVPVEDVAPQALTPDELAVVLKRLVQNRKQVEMVYGSTTIKPQLAPKLRGWRKLGDIEAQLKVGVSEDEAGKLARQIVDDLNKGKPARFSIDPDDAKRILVDGHHAVELKLAQASELGVEAQYNLARTGEMSWGMKVAEKPITVEYPRVGKLDIMRLSESGVRKSDAITRAAEGGTFAPPAHRVKDIADYYVILYTFKGERAANAWAKVYGFDGDTLLAAAAKDPPKLEAWRLTPGKTTATSSPMVRLNLPADMASAVQRSSPALYGDITGPMSSPALASSLGVRPSAALLMSSSRRASAPSKPRVTSSQARQSGPVQPSSALRASSSATKRASAANPSSPARSYGGYGSSGGGRGGQKGGGGGGGGDTPPPAYPPPPVPVPFSDGSGSKRVPKQAIGGVPAGKASDDTGRVQWKQGAYWVMVEPPPTEGKRQRNVYYSRRPFWGVRVVKGNPEQTFAYQGNPPKRFLYAMGVTSVDVFPREKPHLRFRATGAGRARRRRGRLI